MGYLTKFMIVNINNIIVITSSNQLMEGINLSMIFSVTKNMNNIYILISPYEIISWNQINKNIFNIDNKNQDKAINNTITISLV